MDRKLVECIHHNLECARAQHVCQKQKNIKFGAHQAWADVEADEVDLGKEVSMDKKAAKRKQWGGIVERGHPSTLEPQIYCCVSAWPRAYSQTRLEARGLEVFESESYLAHRWSENLQDVSAGHLA